MAIVWQLSIINLEKKALVSGVVLRELPPMHSGRITSLKNLFKLSRSYFIKRFSNEKISILNDKQTIETTTDENGSFYVEVDFNISGELSIASGSDPPMEIVQDYPIIFENSTADFDVISDVDDTLMVSHTAALFKRVGTLAFTVPQRRKAIPFTKKLLEEFTKLNARVFYVSKSESNLFNMIVSIIKYHHLPQGVLILTPYLKFRQLFNYDKGHDYKENHIRFLFENSDKKKFVLLGDDSQRDLEVYADIAKAYPDRVLRIYIRQTQSYRKKAHKEIWERIESSGVSARYFKSEDSIDDELKYVTS